jgi:predicted dehydrogenase
LRYVTKYKGGTMPRGRQPDGEQAMTAAERQARYRARHAHAVPPARPPRRHRQATPGQPPSRPQRWHAAVAELAALQAEYAAWLEALPEATRDGATGQALQAIIDLDLADILAIEPPRGFGRD